MNFHAPTLSAPFRARLHGRAPGAIVLGGAHGGLAITRSLGRHGIPVCFLTHDHPLAGYSRYARHNLRWQGPDHPNALGVLIELVREHQLHGWVLFVGGDAEVRFVARHHDELARVLRLTTPPWNATRYAYDKALTYERARDIGIGFPWSRYPTGVAELADLECSFPLVLKPTVRERVNAFTRAKAWRANDRAELIALYERAASMVGASAIVLQELIPGGGAQQYSYAAAWRDGAPIASLVARRARQYPVDFGFTSTYVETVTQPEVEEAAERFLKSIAYDGLVEVEFKQDSRDGRFKILDVNARAWTWAALGALAGVDLPHLAWRLAIGEDVAPARGATGVAWMHVARDLVASTQEMARGTLAPAAYAASLRRPLVFAAFAADDPLPGLVEMPLVIARLIGRRLRP
ncbi:MAG: ATP-grasp domain-containing protein [Proteobacteria bacterium]|nr:ATP-grasp domain-containing protein [Pseudomonadota bacterium]